MDFDVLAVAAAAVPQPRPVPAPPPAAAPPPPAADVRPSGAQPLTADAVRPAPPPRRVELSFHEDLHVLITKVIDERSGETVSQLPVDEVLDLVADLMAQIRQREEA